MAGAVGRRQCSRSRQYSLTHNFTHYSIHQGTSSSPALLLAPLGGAGAGVVGSSCGLWLAMWLPGVEVSGMVTVAQAPVAGEVVGTRRERLWERCEMSMVALLPLS